VKAKCSELFDSEHSPNFCILTIEIECNLDLNFHVLTVVIMKSNSNDI
jgi:hypothetical protein